MNGIAPYQDKLNAMVVRADHLRNDGQINVRRPETGEFVWPGLMTLLQEFPDFARDYADILAGCPDPIVNRSFMLNMGTERLLQEWNIISRACEQRRGPLADASDKNGLQYNLARAENVLKGYCARWLPQQQAPYQQLCNPVVYFEKLYRISRAIYAPEVPVVSIPLTDYNAPDRWQALAHELGHHIYWNALDPAAFKTAHDKLNEAVPHALEQLAGDHAPLWQRWLEEVFADVLGTLLGGAAYVASAQDLVADRTVTKSDLAKDDPDHPCAYLRPLVSLQALREIASRIAPSSLKAVLTGEGIALHGMIQVLGDRWTKFCPEPAQLKHAETGLTMEALRADVEPVVHAILDTPIWPPARPLWELVDYYGKRPTQDDVNRLSELSQGLSDLPSLSSNLAGLENVPLPGIGGPLDFRTASAQGCWNYVRKEVEGAVAKNLLPAQLEPLAFWSKLVELELSEAKYHRHIDCQYDHTHGISDWWWGQHRHYADGTVRPC